MPLPGAFPAPRFAFVDAELATWDLPAAVPADPCTGPGGTGGADHDAGKSIHDHNHDNGRGSRPGRDIDACGPANDNSNTTATTVDVRRVNPRHQRRPTRPAPRRHRPMPRPSP